RSKGFILAVSFPRKRESRGGGHSLPAARLQSNPAVVGRAIGRKSSGQFGGVLNRRNPLIRQSEDCGGDFGRGNRGAWRNSRLLELFQRSAGRSAERQGQ